MPDYSRRHNTDTWQTRFARHLNATDALIRDLDAPGQSFGDLIQRKTSIEEWLSKAAGELHMVYTDESIAKDFAVPIADLILAQVSHAQAVDILKGVIAERVQTLDRIASETRAQETS